MDQDERNARSQALAEAISIAKLSTSRDQRGTDKIVEQATSFQRFLMDTDRNEAIEEAREFFYAVQDANRAHVNKPMTTNPVESLMHLADKIAGAVKTAEERFSPVLNPRASGVKGDAGVSMTVNHAAISNAIGPRTAEKILQAVERYWDLSRRKDIAGGRLRVQNDLILIRKLQELAPSLDEDEDDD
jgi:hypothetical protein